MLIRVRKPIAGENRLTRQKITCCWRSTASFAASNRARFSGSRPNALVTAIPCRLSTKIWIIRSTSVRFSAYSGCVRRVCQAAIAQSSGVVARQARVSGRLRFTM